MTDLNAPSEQEEHAETASGHYETFYIDSFLADLRLYSLIGLSDFIARVGLFYDVPYEEARNVAVKIISYMLREKLIRTMSYEDPNGTQPVEGIILYIEEKTEGVHSTKEMIGRKDKFWFVLSGPKLLRGAAKRFKVLGSQKYKIRSETNPSKIVKDEMKHLRSLLTDEYIVDTNQYLEKVDFEWLESLQKRQLLSNRNK